MQRGIHIGWSTTCTSEFLFKRCMARPVCSILGPFLEECLYKSLICKGPTILGYGRPSRRHRRPCGGRLAFGRRVTVVTINHRGTTHDTEMPEPVKFSAAGIGQLTPHKV